MLRKVEPGIANVCMLHQNDLFDHVRMLKVRFVAQHLQNISQNVGSDDRVVVVVVVLS